MREAGSNTKYDKAKVLSAIELATGKWSLFGGEALLVPLADLEELLKVGYDKWKTTGIQTNGTLITDRHIELFKKYKTSVGISMDGPGPLNDSRWAGTLEATRVTTQRSEDALYRILELARKGEISYPTLIVTIHAGNASVDKWPIMKQWLKDLDAKGLRYINFHVMEMDHEADKFFLPHEQLKQVMLDLWNLADEFKNLKFANFKEITDLLHGKDDDVMCVWHACDPWNTSAVQGIEGDGSPSHCSRTNKDGIDWLPAQGAGVYSKWQIGDFDGQRFHERQLSLYVTPQEDGGCKDCRFWLMCQGQCPGTGDSSTESVGDWRLRSSYCQTWKDLFEEGEQRMLAKGETPVSLLPERKEIEKILYDRWAEGQNCSMSQGIWAQKNGQLPSSQYIGEHTDKYTDSEHGDLPHGDHTDTHGDEHGDEHHDEYSDTHWDGGEHQDIPEYTGPESHADGDEHCD